MKFVDAIYVLMKDGTPYQLPSSDPLVIDRLNAIDARFAFASTDRDSVDAMRKILPDLLDADDDMGLYIGTFTR